MFLILEVDALMRTCPMLDRPCAGGDCALWRYAVDSPLIGAGPTFTATPPEGAPDAGAAGICLLSNITVNMIATAPASPFGT